MTTALTSIILRTTTCIERGGADEFIVYNATMKVVSCHSKQLTLSLGFSDGGFILDFILRYCVMCGWELLNVERKSHQRKSTFVLRLVTDAQTKPAVYTERETMGEKKIMTNLNTAGRCLRRVFVAKQLTVYILNTFIYFTRNGFIFFLSVFHNS